MNRYLLVILSVFSVLTINAQGIDYKIQSIKLSDALSHPENQFSAIQVYKKRLYLISESRLHENAEAKMYAAPLSTLKKCLKDTGLVLPFTKYAIRYLDVMRSKMKTTGNDYEGLEATIFEKGIVYFSVETETASPDGFLIKGRLEKGAVVLDTNYLVTIPKFTGGDGKSIYNACYEAIAKANGKIFAFYEYNYFPQGNFVKVLARLSDTDYQRPQNFPIQTLPFRITDITTTNKHHFTAINYFYKADDSNAVYRPALQDSVNNKLVLVNKQYKNYSRLIDVIIGKDSITWQPLWELPVNYQGHNWECIAAYKKGYFLMNDKYATTKPNKSTLLYLKKKD